MEGCSWRRMKEGLLAHRRVVGVGDEFFDLSFGNVELGMWIWMGSRIEDSMGMGMGMVVAMGVLVGLNG